jgi:hypothetical protein
MIDKAPIKSHSVIVTASKSPDSCRIVRYPAQSHSYESGRFESRLTIVVTSPELTCPCRRRDCAVNIADPKNARVRSEMPCSQWYQMLALGAEISHLLSLLLLRDAKTTSIEHFQGKYPFPLTGRQLMMQLTVSTCEGFGDNQHTEKVCEPPNRPRIAACGSPPKSDTTGEIAHWQLHPSPAGKMVPDTKQHLFK